MSYAAKEEILRNIVRAHEAILIEGWTGTGKTVTAVKALKGMGNVYYYTEPVRDELRDLSKYNDKLSVVGNLRELCDLKPGKQCIVFDNLDNLGREARSILEKMVQERAEDRRIIVIAQVVLDAQDILEKMDVVVRFKKNTAEILHSKLIDLDG